MAPAVPNAAPPAAPAVVTAPPATTGGGAVAGASSGPVGDAATSAALVGVLTNLVQVLGALVTQVQAMIGAQTVQQSPVQQGPIDGGGPVVPPAPVITPAAPKTGTSENPIRALGVIIDSRERHLADLRIALANYQNSTGADVSDKLARLEVEQGVTDHLLGMTQRLAANSGVLSASQKDQLYAALTPAMNSDDYSTVFSVGEGALAAAGVPTTAPTLPAPTAAATSAWRTAPSPAVAMAQLNQAMGTSLIMPPSATPVTGADVLRRLDGLAAAREAVYATQYAAVTGYETDMHQTAETARLQLFTSAGVNSVMHADLARLHANAAALTPAAVQTLNGAVSGLLSSTGDATAFHAAVNSILGPA